MKLTAILAGEKISRRSTTSVGVVRRPAEHDGIQLDDDDGTFLSRGELERALEQLIERQLRRMTNKRTGERKNVPFGESWNVPKAKKRGRR